MKIYVTSKSTPKLEGVKAAAARLFPDSTVKGFSCQSNVSPQPFGFRYGLQGAMSRIQDLEDKENDKPDLIISIENYIDVKNDVLVDMMMLVFKNVLRQEIAIDKIVCYPLDKPDALQIVLSSEFNHTGYMKTYGSVLCQLKYATEPGDWYQSLGNKMSRKEIVEKAVFKQIHDSKVTTDPL